MTMQGVVPAAGEGTRMRPLTADKPKGLVEVAGKPLLSHVFDALAPVVSEYVVIVGYRGEDIREYYGDRYDGTSITYVTQPERKGLAHALLHAEPVVDDDFVLLNGDNVARANLGEAVEHHREMDADVTMLVEEVSREQAGKGAVIDQGEGRVTGLVEKPDNPPSTLVPRGFYVLTPRIFHACHLVTPDHTGEYELTAALDLLLAAGRRLETVPLDGWFYNVNTPADREEVTERLAE